MEASWSLVVAGLSNPKARVARWITNPFDLPAGAGFNDD
jgi:hypothetical protein